MGRPYAEVIGDPIDHSKSPLIHSFWLEKLGLQGEYRRRRVRRGELAAYLKESCRDPWWRGCSVAAPLKQEAAAAANDPTGVCARIGAANAIFRSPLGCGVGANTDVIGIAEALGAHPAPAASVCIIGAGGAARAVLEFLRVRGIGQLTVIAREPAKGRNLLAAANMPDRVESFDQAADALSGAEWVINASPLGQIGMPPMPETILRALDRTRDDAVVFDVVYAPPETELLREARRTGRRTVDGLAMLVGQAATAFELFFGRAAPREHDPELRERLTS